ncbi:MAG TPA: hypothetical protein VJ103_02030 [Candidatus Paceibacterota bacterium]|nr:hypothetical protein [Candidatus Paceibacterota bacterium]
MVKYILALVLVVGIAGGIYLMNAKADAKNELKAPEPLMVIG